MSKGKKKQKKYVTITATDLAHAIRKVGQATDGMDWAEQPGADALCEEELAALKAGAISAFVLAETMLDGHGAEAGTATRNASPKEAARIVAIMAIDAHRHFVVDDEPEEAASAPGVRVTVEYGS